MNIEEETRERKKVGKIVYDSGGLAVYIVRVEIGEKVFSSKKKFIFIFPVECCLNFGAKQKLTELSSSHLLLQFLIMELYMLECTYSANFFFWVDHKYPAEFAI